MRVSFVLPTSGRIPSGGHRVVYQHANYLRAEGHSVHIVHFSNPQPESHAFRERVRQYVRYLRDRYIRGYRPTAWFNLDERIGSELIYSAAELALPECDVVVATAWETAEPVFRKATPASRKIYFIQSLETWSGSEERVLATWRLPMKRLVISEWLRDIANDLGLDAVIVPNGIDLNLFRLRTPIEQRDDRAVLFQSMRRELKGSKEIVESLNALRSQGLDLKITAFGQVDPAVFGLEQPYSFHENPSQPLLAGLYDKAAVYVTASHVEGWGMTMTEAAACGAALAVSDIGGHRSFARPNENALLFSPREPVEIASCIARLVGDHHLRCALAQRAYSDAIHLTWDRSSAAFERAIAT